MAITNLQRALDVTDDATLILSNGGKMCSESPDTISELLDDLNNYTLDPSFEQWGWFSSWNQRVMKT